MSRPLSFFDSAMRTARSVLAGLLLAVCLPVAAFAGIEGVPQDGTDHNLAAASNGDALTVKSDVVDQTSATTIIPASLWNSALMQQSVLLNTLDGHEMPVKIETIGMEKVKVKGAEREATHVRVSGGLDRDLWYSPEGSLVRVQFATKDGSKIEYVLR